MTKLVCLRNVKENNNNIIGLNEDGDFAMLGVNMQDTTNNSGQDTPQSSLSSSISNDYLSSLLFPNLSLQNKNDDTNPQQQQQQQQQQSLSSLSIIPDTDATANMERIQTPTSSLSSSFSLSQEQKYNNPDLDVQEQQQEAKEQLEMEQWLQTQVMPTLEPIYIKSYARNLVAIGFHPDCVTRYELTMEDLTFMKLLHRKFFFHEIIGTNTAI